MPSFDTHWTNLIRDSIETPEAFACAFGLSEQEVLDVIRVYPARVNPYYMQLIRKNGTPLFLQAIPRGEELVALPGILPDGLCEKEQSPVPGLVHRYPDRVILTPSSSCALFCRYCMRKRDLGKTRDFDEKGILAYIAANRKIRDVILSGGDPFMLSDEKLESLLQKIRVIPHVELVRIHTRMPCTLPQRVTQKLCTMLKAYFPIFVNIHFSHPAELTEESRRACGMLADSGIPLGGQTVLLKGINDTPGILSDLFRKLLSMRIKPYYLHHPDPVAGIFPFRMDLEEGLRIYRKLRGFISGMAVPSYMIDLPGGGGKLALSAEHAYPPDEKGWIRLHNFEGKPFYYPALASPAGPAPDF